jgi:YesN/AraC family two-component response regulator
MLPTSFHILAQSPSGYVLTQEIKSKDFSLWYHTILLSQDDTLLITCAYPVISLNFSLENGFSFHRSDLNQQFFVNEGQYNMSHFPNVDLIGEFQKNKPYRFLTIFYSAEYLSKLASAYPSLVAFLQRAANMEESLVYPINQHSTKQMKQILFSILHDDCKEEEIAMAIRQGKMLELLVKAVEQPLQPSSSCPVRLPSQDAEKIHKARSWLDEQFNKPVTLFELAKKVGMNVHKLSSGFLQVVGTTVFYYHRQVRMNRAIQLLEDTDRDLFDIGTEVGYFDGKSFSKEFKKYNGATPLEYRKHCRSQTKWEPLN